MEKSKRLLHTDDERKEEKNVTGMLTKLSLSNGSNVSSPESKTDFSDETTTAFASYILNSSTIQNNTGASTDISVALQKKDFGISYTSGTTLQDDLLGTGEQTNVTVSGTKRNLKTEAESTQTDAISPEEKETFENKAGTKMKDSLKESLGVSEEEIEDAMEKLGLSGLDLLNPTNLTALVGELTGTSDMAELLVSSSMQDLLKNAQELADAFSEATGLTVSQLTEQLGMDASDDSLDENLLENLQGNSILKEAGNNASKVLDDATAKEQDVINNETTSVDAADAKTASSENDGTDQTNEQASKDDTKSFLQDAKDQRANIATTVDNSMAQQSFTTSLENTVFGGETQGANASYVDAKELMQQLVDFAKLHVKQDTTSLEMQLNPEKLGKLMIHVSEKAGEVTAEIQTQSEVVKEALESQIATLKTSLEGQGVKVNAVEVTVASHAFEENLDKQADAGTEQNQEQENAQNKSTRKNLIASELDDLTGLLSEEEMLVAQIMKDHGNSVDMMA